MTDFPDGGAPAREVTTAVKVSAPIAGRISAKTESVGVVHCVTTSTLTSGAHSITATYNGNANFDGSSASLTQTVN